MKKTYNEYYEIQCPSSESWEQSLEKIPEHVKVAGKNNVDAHYEIVDPDQWVFSVILRYDSRKDFANYLAGIMNHLNIQGIELGEAIKMSDLNQTKEKMTIALKVLEKANEP